jgi:transcriptional antiterminator NusG
MTMNEHSMEDTNHDARLAKGDSPDFRWYIVHALSGYENRVAKSLKERAVDYKLTECFSDIIVPEETVQNNVNGKKRTVKKKLYPGYVLIKMIMNEKTWHLVKNTDKVTGFIGGTKDKPSPLSDEEASFMTNQVAEGFKRPKTNFNLSEGDSVKVTEGPFASFVGVIESINEKGKIKVQVSIFGRPTPVELDFSQVEKV